MALSLKIKPKTLTLTLNPARSLRPFSSPPDDSNGGGGGGEGDKPPSPPSFSSSLFSDIKERLKSPSPPPRRIPTDPSRTPSPFFSSSSPKLESLHDIRKHLAEFRLKSPNPNPNPNSHPSFQDLIKDKVLSKPDASNETTKPNHITLDSIRASFSRQNTKSLPSSYRLHYFQESLRPSSASPADGGNLPEAIFGRELREKKGEAQAGAGEGEAKGLRTEFVKMYTHEELGEKLRKLRPAAAAKGKKDWFSLEELNTRLVKLREMEEKEMQGRVGGSMFHDLRTSLVRLKESEISKKNNMQRLSILANIGMHATPAFMLKPPQEQLLENFFHPDHLSSAEKLKLELKKVRDEFKMSESDCGSARVQIAQLTTKIKHLTPLLHKKDKHSRKGLREMAQRRKKLLKYLRRTDWDSYCFVLSKLGLKDTPEYKTPDYKVHN